LYPLAADLNGTAPRDSRAATCATRGSRSTGRRAPDLVILPDEPHAFSDADEAVLRGALPAARFVRIYGKDLFWYGAWTIEAIDRLAGQLAA
jgi:hypothetical protein